MSSESKKPKAEREEPGYPEEKQINVNRRRALMLLGAGAAAAIAAGCGGRERNPGSVVRLQPTPDAGPSEPETENAENAEKSPNR